MIKKFIKRLLGKSEVASQAPSLGQREEVAQAVHGIDVQRVDPRALDVVHTLKAAGYEAYIVGGAVRDLLLGLKPKDFDVATNATPEQVKSLFRRAFIIGRRFRIVHVVYGRGREHEVIEVSTFRAFMDASKTEQVDGNERTSRNELAGLRHAVDASGRVLRDNVWGPQDQDAARRDFTVNAMYYDPERQIVVDYHGGIRDAKKRTLRMIGDPAARYREDPVRIIRAVRFAAKLSPLGFSLERKTAAPLVKLRGLLKEIPQSRLFDEMLKLLQTGHAQATLVQLAQLGLGRGIDPLLDLVVERGSQPFVRAALEDTDRRVGEGKPVAPSFLLASVLWADVRESWERLRQKLPAFTALQDAIDEVFNARIGDVSGRGKLAADMREIWMMQPRFDKRSGHFPYGLVEQPRFRAGFDFMRLRAQVGEVEDALAQWWEAFSLAGEGERQALQEQVRDSAKSPARRGRARTRTRGAPADAADTGFAATAERAEVSGHSADGAAAAPEAGDPAQRTATESGAGAPPRKRRPRRRKPGSGTGAAENTER